MQLQTYGTSLVDCFKPFKFPWDTYVPITPIVQCSVCIIVYLTLNYYLTLSAHAREGYSSHFVSLSVSLSLFHSEEDADFRVETYISIHSR